MAQKQIGGCNLLQLVRRISDHDRPNSTSCQTQTSRSSFHRLSLSTWLAIGTVLLTSPLSAVAQSPIADDTLGNKRSVVSPDRVINTLPSNQIDGGARRGANLFHSFREFNIDLGRGIYFTNPAGITNILTRVTGGNPSQILGTLGVLGNANLFLLNPNGILFGSNAQLDIRGSFVASTGDRFSFPDGSEFSATNPQVAPLLTVNVPIGLQVGTQAGAISNRGNLAVGQDLTLTGGNLDLEGQLQAGRDLTLLAQGTVQVRDTASRRFAAIAGRDLTLQGNGSIDILALRHLAQTPFVSGGALSLISDGVISADAHFASGGDFQIRSLSGQPAQITSLYDPIISSAANVNIAGGYSGASLLIESQRNVQIQGAVTITAPDPVSSFIGADMVLNTRPGLIIRSGQTNLVYSSINQGNPPVSTNGNIPAGITLGRDVRVVPSAQGGVVNLTATAGNISATNINTFNVGGGDGGAIALSASGNISTSNLNTVSALDAGNAGNSGNSGVIALSAGGNLSTGTLFSFSRSSSTVGNAGIAGDGGTITLSAGGNLSTSDLNSASVSQAINAGNSGNSGAISLSAGGTIATGTLFSFSRSSSTVGNAGIAGDGGTITLNAGGTITTSDLNSDSISRAGNVGNAENTGNAGAITLSARGGISTGNLSSSTRSSSTQGNTGDAGNGGAIVLNAGGNISASSLNSFSSSRSDSFSRLTLIMGNTGNGGRIALSAGGNISASDLNSSSSSNLNYGISGNTGDGGAITLNAIGSISISNLFSSSGSNSFSLFSNIAGNAGNGGAIALSAGGNITTRDLSSTSASNSGGTARDARNGGTITVSAGGNVATTNLNSSSGSYSNYFNVGNAGDGGTTILNAGGNITTGFLISDSVSSVFNGNGGKTGNGGGIVLSAGSNIITNFLDSSSRSDTSIAGNGGDTGSGGAIALSAAGNLTTRGLNSSSISSPGNNSGNAGNAGNGGAITLFSSSGDVSAGAAIEWGSSTPGRSNGALRVNTPGGVQFGGSLRPNNDADTVIGDQLAPRTVQLPGAILTRGGDFSLAVAGDYRLQDTDLITSSRTGDSGQIQIQTPGTLTLERSRLFTSIEPGRTGTGGNITLNVGNLVLNDFSVINTATFGTGDAGNLSITAAHAITLNQSDIVSVTAGNGNAGQIAIQARGDVTLQNRSSISTAARDGAVGRGGDIEIGLGTGTLTLTEGSQLQAFTLGRGAGGNITIQAPQVTVTGFDTDGLRSGIFTSSDRPTSGSGGNITVTTPGTLRVADDGVLSAQTLSSAPGGNISIAADTVELLNRGQLITNTAGSGRAGTITLNAARQVVISGDNPALQETVLPVFTCAITGASCGTNDNPNVEFSTRIPHVTVGGPRVTGNDIYTVNISTPGTRAVFDIDNGGSALFTSSGQRFIFGIDTNLALVNAQGINLATNDNADSSLGEGGSQADTLGLESLVNGRDAYLRYVFNTAGTYTIRLGKNAATLGDPRSNYALHVSLEAPAVAGRVVETSPSSGLFARTTGSGEAGNIRINTPQLNLFDQGRVSVETAGQGKAGDITVQVGDRLFLTGRGTGLFASTTLGSTGNGGNIAVNPRLVQIEDGAAIAVNSQGRGTGGNIALQADRLELNSQGSITAETASAQGGNITLDVRNLLLLRRNSLISATAGTAQAGGDGGNITFTGNFLVAVPIENSDISANAFTGSGGRVNVTAQGIFGTQFRSQLTPLSDITASSDFGAAGVVAITTPDIDPNRGLVQLPVDLADASRLIAQTCPNGNGNAKQPSEFIITGRGGLPPTPSEAVNRDAIQVDLVTADVGDRPPVSQRESAQPASQLSNAAIVEAQGLQVAANGAMFLVAAAPKNAIAPALNRPIHCPQGAKHE